MGNCFKQKRAGYKSSFSFSEEELTYTFDNSRMKTGSSIPYHKIPACATYREVKMWWLKYVAVFYASVCAMMTEYSLDTNNLPQLPVVLYAATLFFLLCSLLACMRYHGRITSYPVTPLLSILHDGQQREIRGEMAKRRLASMREKLAHVDFNRPYYEEAAKFSWLHEEGVVTDEEYQQARHKIAALRDKAAQPPPGRGSVN